MIETACVEIKKMIIHKIGNSTLGEDLELSAETLILNDSDISTLLTKYFLKPFNQDEQYSLTHLSDVNLNEVYNYVSKIFSDESEFEPQSKFLSEFLYRKSIHPKIKSGELYVVYFANILLGAEFTEAIGLFKSESKETFLKVHSKGKNWELSKDSGININKLAKGCLIFKKNEHDGYLSLIVDNANKNGDAEYWVKEFLQVQPNSNNYFQTDKMLGMYKQFVRNEVLDKFDLTKTDQIGMLNRSITYFREKDEFNMQEFTEDVIHYPDVVNAFNNYKESYEAEKKVSFNEQFEIHQSAVKKQERSYKSVLKLDGNFHIYIHGNNELVEKGYDSGKNMNYYKLYFREEK